MPKLTNTIKSTIIYAAAAAAYLVAVEEAQRDAAEARGMDGDEDAAEWAASRYDEKLARLSSIMDAHDLPERLRRHAIRTLRESPSLHAKAEQYLRDHVLPMVGGLDPREGGTLLVHSLGPDWRQGPAVRLDAGRTTATGPLIVLG